MKKLTTASLFKHLDSGDNAITLEGEKLRSLQAVLSEMLLDIEAVCDVVDCDYFLAGGSCLGAIRHGGFIPWDDDLDVCMTRAGYEHFKKAFISAFSDKYWLHDPRETHNYALGMPQIRMKGTTVRGREDFLTDECGVCVDIFIVENIPENMALRFVHGVVSMALGFALSCRKFAEFEEQFLNLVGTDEEIVSVFKTKARIGRVLSLLSLDSWTHLWDRWNSCYQNTDSIYVAIPVGRCHYFGETFARNELFPTEAALFGGIPSRVPRNFDKYLSALYGDYMKVPDSNNREAHLVYEFDLGNKA